MNAHEFISENQKRKEIIFKPYNPRSGEGANGNREYLHIEDAPIPHLWIPVEMKGEPIYKKIKKYKTIKEFLKQSGFEFTQQNFVETWILFCETRYKYDFEFFAITCETIEDKMTKDLIKFKLNRGQRELLSVLEEMRLLGVPIRIILLKARQYGGSTLVQLYMNWIQIIHKRNWSSVICAHLMSAAVTIRAMFDIVTQHMVPINGKRYEIKNFEGASSIKIIKERGCRITIGSAESPDSIRSQAPMMAHFSEVAKYPNTDKKGTSKLIGSIVGAIPYVPYSLIVHESTANGVGDYFHEEWQKATKGHSGYRNVFVPTHMIDIYSLEFDGYYFNENGQKTKGTIEEFIQSLTTYEVNLFTNKKICTLEHINWRRVKRSEMPSEEEMQQDYPEDDTEAFQNSGLPAFNANHVEELRKDCTNPILGDLIGDSSPAEARMNAPKRKTCLQGLRFIQDDKATEGFKSSDPKIRLRHERNKLKIWDFPDKEQKVTDRYVVSYDPSKGITDKADFGVIKVIDRYWRIFGGVSEVVAVWRGHDDKDINLWLACQVAMFYNKALLVIENNTYDSEQKDDDSEFIYDTIVDYYSNLYSRTSADDIREGLPIKYGWNTNRKTKPMLIAHYTAVLREKLYVERSENALDEARWYEKKKNGKYGAKEGKHDDECMATMIGCYVDYELPLPRIIDTDVKIRLQKQRTEATI
jgi:hypothetical protein